MGGYSSESRYSGDTPYSQRTRGLMLGRRSNGLAQYAYDANLYGLGQNGSVTFDFNQSVTFHGDRFPSSQEMSGALVVSANTQMEEEKAGAAAMRDAADAIAAAIPNSRRLTYDRMTHEFSAETNSPEWYPAVPKLKDVLSEHRLVLVGSQWQNPVTMALNPVNRVFNLDAGLAHVWPLPNLSDHPSYFAADLTDPAYPIIGPRDVYPWPAPDPANPGYVESARKKLGLPPLAENEGFARTIRNAGEKLRQRYSPPVAEYIEAVPSDAIFLVVGAYGFTHPEGNRTDYTWSWDSAIPAYRRTGEAVAQRLRQSAQMAGLGIGAAAIGGGLVAAQLGLFGKAAKPTNWF